MEAIQLHQNLDKKAAIARTYELLEAVKIANPKPKFLPSINDERLYFSSICFIYFIFSSG